MMRPTCLVVALGNPLHGPDGFGHAVARRLRAGQDLPACAELVDAATDLLSWIDRFGAYDQVVLVDAVLGGSRREVAIVEEAEFDGWAPHAVTGHEISPLLAVKLLRALRPDCRTRFCLVGLKVDIDAAEREVTPAETEAGAAAVVHLLQRTA